MSAIAVIPARGGSRRIKHKNSRDFHGHPIIAYSIWTARDSNLFRRIIVSTDDDKIFDFAEALGAEGHMRDPNYARDEVGTQEVMRECLTAIDCLDHVACCIYATAPLMRPSDLVIGYHQLVARSLDYVFTVGYPPLRDAGQWYFGMTNCFIERRPLVGPNTGLYLLPPERVCDINDESDLIKAEELYHSLMSTR